LEAINIIWFRRDLRLHDNHALHAALTSGLPVLPLLIFDRNILDDLEDKADKRVEFIHNTIIDIDVKLKQFGASLNVFYGYPADVFKELSDRYRIHSVLANEDYELYAIQRDNAIKELLHSYGAELQSFKDQAIFAKEEVIKPDGKPYTVFTPYSRTWRQRLENVRQQDCPSEKYLHKFLKQPPSDIPTLEEMGFERTGTIFPSAVVEEELLSTYEKTRDYPGIEGTSRLGIHLRFGTVSVRQILKVALRLNAIFVNELIWRDFYFSILYHFPNIGQGKAFKPQYDAIRWRNKETEFQAWCEGRTGYPIVDAGMRQLNETGWMHNRVRMITASFLCKHLLIDWRWGEAYFAKKLLDYDFSANNGGWQWASGSGCDAAPYFRIFNPTLQTKKFDPELKYVKRWVPELDTFDYPAPIVDHEFARKRCLQVYQAALQQDRRSGI
jgi:deoxyribodipyrimidine photo-lyase